MAPRHEYDLRVSASTFSYEVLDNLKPVTISMESDELVVPHEESNVTLDKLKDFVFADEDADEDPEYVESSAESEDSLEFELENEAPHREYGLRAPGATPSCEGMDDLKPVTVKFEWDQLIVPHEEGDVTLDKLNEFVFEVEDEDEDPEYEESCDESDDSLEYESEDNESESEDEDCCLDELTSQEDVLASVVTESCSDLLERNDMSWSLSNKAEEYISSFGVSQFGIRLVDFGLSVVESPISYFSTWMSDSVSNSRRNLRAARRAGEKINDSCKARSLLVHMANLFPMNTVLDSMGVALVEETLYESLNKNKKNVVDEDIEDDPEYVLSSEESDDSIEFRSDIDSEEEKVSYSGSDDESSDEEITCSSEDDQVDTE